MQVVKNTSGHKELCLILQSISVGIYHDASVAGVYGGRWKGAGTGEGGVRRVIKTNIIRQVP